MLKRLGQSLRIGIGRDSLCLIRVSRWHGPRLSVLAEQGFDAQASDMEQQLEPQLQQLLNGISCAHLPTTVVLADDLVRLWQVTPPQGSSRIADIQAAAALRFQSLFGETLSGWQISADWDANQTFFAAALPVSLIEVVNRQAQQHQLALVEIAPQFILAWNRWYTTLKPGAWFALHHENLLTLGVPDGQKLSAIRSILVPPSADQAWLQTHLGRQALLLNIPAPTLLQLCGPLPTLWSDQNDTSSITCSQCGPRQAGLARFSPTAELALTGAWL
jgi:hypothetical protein